MNRQPFTTPPRAWESKMTPWLVRLWRPAINRTLRRSQKIVDLRVEGVEHVQAAIEAKAGILITPNHSFHYDSYALIEASHRVGKPFHFLSAWQVFAMSTWFEQRVLQWHGCYSINREGTDLAAFKTSVEILRASEFPLVIFPEGDIYHTNDRVTPFRDGATAIAMSAAKKADRAVVCIPCAVKAFYVDDPTPNLSDLMARLEESLHWRPRPDLALPERIYRLAEALLSLKEHEHCGRPREGTVRERVAALSDAILVRLETKHGVPNKGGIIPERVRDVRRAVIKATEKDGITVDETESLAADMEDLFLVIQLFSYPGDWVANQPSIERIAETLDKFEEDVLKADYPAVRGTRRVVVRFGVPISVPKERGSGTSVEDWTHMVESKVQGLLDEINAASR